MFELPRYQTEFLRVKVPDEMQALAHIGKKLLDIAYYESAHFDQNHFLLRFHESSDISQATWQQDRVGNAYPHEGLEVSLVRGALILAVHSRNRYKDGLLEPYSSVVIQDNTARLVERDPMRAKNLSATLPDEKFEYFTNRLYEQMDTFKINYEDIKLKKAS